GGAGEEGAAGPSERGPRLWAALGPRRGGGGGLRSPPAQARQRQGSQPGPRGRLGPRGAEALNHLDAEAVVTEADVADARHEHAHDAPHSEIADEAQSHLDGEIAHGAAFMSARAERARTRVKKPSISAHAISPPAKPFQWRRTRLSSSYQALMGTMWHSNPGSRL